MDDDRDPRFACPCCGENQINPRLEWMIGLLEDAIEHKLSVSSGFRCKKHNKEVGGSETSSHLTGLAGDIECKYSRLRYMIVGAAIQVGFHRIGLGKNFIHLDIDKGKSPRVIWIYT